MSPVRTAAASLFAAILLAPAALGEGILPVNPIVNGDFDTFLTPGMASGARGVADRCFGIGHQYLPALYWPEETLVEDATAHAQGFVEEPGRLYECDPQWEDNVQLNAWEKSRDRGFMWSNDPGTLFDDFDGDGDLEAIIPRVPTSHSHNMWQSGATATQAFSANFEAFEFTIESGTPAPGANIQVGLSLSPGYMQHPWVGAFWEGAILFRADDFQPDAGGRVSIDPIARGEIICPGGYQPCFDFKAAYDAALGDEESQRTLLGQTRIGQTSFWAFNNGVAPIVIDEVAYVGATTFAETVPNPNPGA